MKPKLGQHFLADQSVLAFEAESAAVKGAKVLEIGAGDGRLTRKLLSEGAAHITAAELDPKLAKSLRLNFQKRVKVFEGDILAYPEDDPFDVVIGNIPYYITSPILFKLVRMRFSRGVLCIQKEVAARLLAEPGTADYGRLSVSSQLQFEVELLALVERTAFVPPPKVDSAIISIKKTGRKLSDQEEKVIGAIFSHKKKSLRNAVIDARQALFSTDDKKAAAVHAERLKYSARKVFTLSPSEALEAAEQLCQWTSP